MKEKGLAQFVARMNVDQELRRQISEAEQAAIARTARLKPDIDAVNRENLEALLKIARSHGYELEVDGSAHTEMVTPNDQEIENLRCLLTCCWVVTSVWDTEGIPTVEGPGCGPGTTSDCF